MSTGLYVVLAAALVAAVILFLPQTGMNRFLEAHKWFIPFVVLTIGVVTYVEVKGYSERLHSDQVAACERRNPEVASEVVNLQHDRAFLRILRTAVREEFPNGGTKEATIAGLADAIQGKSEAIGEKVAARALYSAHPAGRPAQAVMIDCEAAYPG